MAKTESRLAAERTDPQTKGNPKGKFQTDRPPEGLDYKVTKPEELWDPFLWATAGTLLGL